MRKTAALPVVKSKRKKFGHKAITIITTAINDQDPRGECTHPFINQASQDQAEINAHLKKGEVFEALAIIAALKLKAKELVSELNSEDPDSQPTQQDLKTSLIATVVSGKLAEIFCTLYEKLKEKAPTELVTRLADAIKIKMPLKSQGYCIIHAVQVLAHVITAKEMKYIVDQLQSTHLEQLIEEEGIADFNQSRATKGKHRRQGDNTLGEKELDSQLSQDTTLQREYVIYCLQKGGIDGIYAKELLGWEAWINKKIANEELREKLMNEGRDARAFCRQLQSEAYTKARVNFHRRPVELFTKSDYTQEQLRVLQSSLYNDEVFETRTDRTHFIKTYADPVLAFEFERQVQILAGDAFRNYRQMRVVLNETGLSHKARSGFDFTCFVIQKFGTDDECEKLQTFIRDNREENHDSIEGIKAVVKHCCTQESLPVRLLLLISQRSMNPVIDMLTLDFVQQVREYYLSYRRVDSDLCNVKTQEFWIVVEQNEDGGVEISIKQQHIMVDMGREGEEEIPINYAVSLYQIVTDMSGSILSRSMSLRLATSSIIGPVLENEEVVDYFKKTAGSDVPYKMFEHVEEEIPGFGVAGA